MVARLAPAYAQLLRDLAALGVPEVQASGRRGRGWVGVVGGIGTG